MKIDIDGVVDNNWNVPDGDYQLIEIEKLLFSGSVRLHSRYLDELPESEWDGEKNTVDLSFDGTWHTRDNLTTRPRNVLQVTVINNSIDGKLLAP